MNRPTLEEVQKEIDRNYETKENKDKELKK